MPGVAEGSRKVSIHDFLACQQLLLLASGRILLESQAFWHLLRHRRTRFLWKHGFKGLEVVGKKKDLRVWIDYCYYKQGRGFWNLGNDEDHGVAGDESVASASIQHSLVSKRLGCVAVRVLSATKRQGVHCVRIAHHSWTNASWTAPIGGARRYVVLSGLDFGYFSWKYYTVVSEHVKYSRLRFGIISFRFCMIFFYEQNTSCIAITATDCAG